MNEEQLQRMGSGAGFIAALDQSGGSTPKMLAAYGIPDTAYSGDAEMFDLVHQMRVRILRSPVFDRQRILGSILFENTLDRTVDGQGTAEYLWRVKGVVPFLKVDLGLEPELDGAQVMRPIPELDGLLERARKTDVFGTKMRSFITQANETGIAAVVSQQFDLAARILANGLVPIIEPEVDIRSDTKAEAEVILKAHITDRLASLAPGQQVMLKLSLPDKDDFYADFVRDQRVLRVVALSGGYTRDDADERLARNHGTIASFSRALLQGLSVDQTDAEFDATLDDSIESIFEASIT